MLVRNIRKIFIFISMILLSTSVTAGNIIKSEHTIKSGDGLMSILKNDYIKKDDINNLVYNTKNANKLINLKVGQKLKVYKNSAGELQKLILSINKVDNYIVSPKNGSFLIRKGTYATRKVNQYAIGKVKYSVNKTLLEMGLSKEQRKEFQDMFGSKIDFTKIRKGSTFVAVFPENYIGKRKISTDPLISAEISYGRSQTQVFAFDDYKGVRSYYLKNGEPTTEGISRAPLKYTRISSKFSLTRKHPILGKVKPHTGTDYAAPAGTPIHAAADGKIAMKDVQNGYGKLLVINHSDGYSTLYGHMKKFKKGIYSGKKVKKGDVIGYVGTTGRSTGPHLHYEIRKDGHFLDPVNVDLPSGYMISKNDVSKFKKFTSIHASGINLAKRLNTSDGRTKVAIRSK